MKKLKNQAQSLKIRKLFQTTKEIRPQLTDKCAEVANTRGKMQFVDEKFTFVSKFHKIFKIFLTTQGKNYKFQ